MDFHLRLENLIQERNIKQKDLSAELNFAYSTLNGYVTQHRQPDLQTLVRLARYFDVSTDYLLGLSNEKKPAPSTLNPAEGALIHLYRSLIPERQELLIEQAKFYQSLSMKHSKSSKKE